MEEWVTGSFKNMGHTYGSIVTERTINNEVLWSDNDSMRELRDRLATIHINQIDLNLLEELKRVLEEPIQKTKEERVIDIVCGGFEKHFNMSLDEFNDIYKKILEDDPEKLI